MSDYKTDQDRLWAQIEEKQFRLALADRNRVEQWKKIRDQFLRDAAFSKRPLEFRSEKFQSFLRTNGDRPTVELSSKLLPLLGQLLDRGVNFSEPRLYLLDGGKALRAAVVSFAGDAAFIQRCQVHKIRNMTGYLAEAERPAMKFRMRAAYMQPEAVDAKNALFKLHDELMEANPSRGRQSGRRAGGNADGHRVAHHAAAVPDAVQH